MTRNNFKIGTRIASGYAVILLLLGVCIGVALYMLHQSQEGMRRITEVNNVRIALVSAMRDTVSDRMVISRSVAILTDADTKRSEWDRIRAQEQVYARDKVRLARTFDEPGTAAEEKAFFAKLQGNEADVLALAPQLQALTIDNRTAEANDVLLSRMAPLQEVWLETLNALARHKRALSTATAHEARAAYRTTVMVMLMLGALAGAMGIGAAAMSMRSLRRQLGGSQTMRGVSLQASLLATSQSLSPSRPTMLIV